MISAIHSVGGGGGGGSSGGVTGGSLGSSGGRVTVPEPGSVVVPPTVMPHD
ncbi:MAG: hypothetical protein AAFZ92_02465 [Pseudomonadota bacterium]